jgi:hypothetical protein
MAVFETGYRAWNGKRTGASSRWLTICSSGIGRAYKSKWLRRLMLAAVFPLMYFTLPFVLFEQSTQNPQMFQAALEVIRTMPQAQMLQDEMLEDQSGFFYGGTPDVEQIDQLRHDVWSFLFLTLMRYPQAVLMIVLVAIVAPPLISQDLRTRAYLIYFSRPLTRGEYILGKFGIVGFFVALICATPPLLLYVLGLMLTSDPDQILHTWDLPLRIMCATFVVTVPVTLLALAMSSLTLESRYAAFAWFALWISGHIIFSVLYASMDMHHFDREILTMDPGWRIMTSPYQVLGIIQSAIFGFKVERTQLIISCLMVAATSIGSFVILFNRVQAPMRA